MILRMDPASPVPPYEQLRGQLAAMIAGGVLPVGERLPTIRQLAADLGLADGTVARTYRELERDGLISSRRRHGTFVADRGHTTAEEREREAVAAAESFAAQAARLGIDPRLALEQALRALQADAPGRTT